MTTIEWTSDRVSCAPCDLLEDYRRRTVEELRALGNPPRGFQYADGTSIPCNPAAPAFVRGILMPTADYNKLSFDARFKLSEPDVYPRWRLYGGPLSRQDAEQWDTYLTFYAFNTNQTWVSHGVVCVVPSWILPWPADSGVDWGWVDETRRPDVASRVWNQQAGRYEVKWAS